MTTENIHGDDAGRGRRAAGNAAGAFWSRHSLSLKLMFAHPALMVDFMLSFLPEYARMLDLTTLGRPKLDLASIRPDRRFTGTVWQAAERAVARLPGFVLVEFQAWIDPEMAEYMARYNRGVRLAWVADAKSAGESDEGPQIAGLLPVVLYTGRAQWTASLYRKGESANEVFKKFQPPPRYKLVDLARSRCEDLDGTSVFAVVQQICRAESLEEVAALWSEMTRRALARGGEGACVATAACVMELLEQTGEPAANRNAAKEGRDRAEQAAILLLEERAKQWNRQWFEKGLAEGAKEARAEQAAMLLRLAEWKFGPEAAEWLAGIATAGAARGDLARLGDWIIDCRTLQELLARVGMAPVETEPPRTSAETPRGPDGEEAGSTNVC